MTVQRTTEHGRRRSGPRARGRRERPAGRGRGSRAAARPRRAARASGSSTHAARRCATSTSSTTKRMHLILARRDLTGFQHLHPEQAADGTWTTPVRLDEAGSYRLFADFSHDDEAQTLAADLRVDGDADLRAAARRRAHGGERRRLRRAPRRRPRPRPALEADLRFTITKNGVPVRTEPYLGAGGHLVALREGDLAFLHVHPSGTTRSASRRRSRRRAATACSCSSSTRAVSRPSPSPRRW